MEVKLSSMLATMGDMGTGRPDLPTTTLRRQGGTSKMGGALRWAILKG